MDDEFRMQQRAYETVAEAGAAATIKVPRAWEWFPLSAQPGCPPFVAILMEYIEAEASPIA